MAEARSKAGIVERLGTERERLERTVAPLAAAEMLEGGVVGEWSVKDVLAHLADWEAHMLVWLEAARRGDAVRGPDPGLSWSQIKRFNRRVYDAHRDERLEEVLAEFHGAHERFMEMVAAMPEEEMLARGRYALTAPDAVYEWLVAYAEHDAWGAKRVREWMQAREPPAESTPGRSP